MNASATSRFELPFLQAGRALKNITHNEALQRLDSGLYLSCSDMAADDLPPEPIDGTALIISNSPEPDLADRVGKIGVFVNGSWSWFTPKSGWTLWDETGETLRVFDGTIWVGPAPDISPETLPQLGIDASAAPNQRLSVASDTTLFTHDGNSHRLILNRADIADTASLVFQTGFSGEAEIALTEAKGFSIKMSADGSNFFNRLNIPADYQGIMAPAFRSQTVTLAADTTSLIPTPAPGGIFAITVISNSGFPRATHSGLFAYDTGPSPTLISLAVTNRVENHNDLTLDGTISASGNLGLSATSSGLYVENRIGNSRDISLTFIC